MTPIGTAVADGDAIEQHLIAAGFDPKRIERYSNLPYSKFRKVIDNALVAYKTAAAFVFYYSGHGILYGSQPRFIPTDFNFVKLTGGKLSTGIPGQTIPAMDIIQIAKEAGGPALFIFDACRDEGGGLFPQLFPVEQREATGDGRPPMMSLSVYPGTP